MALKIPKIIHQMWIGPLDMPKKMIDTWTEKNPEWEHILWTEEEIKRRYPNGFINQKAIDEHQSWCGKCDIMRYEILYDYGGFFPDADCVCTNSLDDHFLNHAFFSCFENEKVRPDLISVGYMGSIKGCELMKKCTEFLGEQISLDERKTGMMAWQMTGPVLITGMIHKTKYPAFIYPSYVFIPKHYTGETYTGSGKSYSDQYWGSTFGYDNLPK